MPSPADRNKTQPFRISSQTLATIRELTHHRSQWSAASRRDTGQIDTWTQGLESDRQDSALGLRARKNAEATRPIEHRPLWAFRHKVTMISMTPRGIEEAGKTSSARAGFLFSHRESWSKFSFSMENSRTNGHRSTPESSSR
ncbi:hypothetical protein [Chromobacterium violaceum]|uniref:hypothetical protein n=1 Tax=Chromobacterium violaceum TaxID=536 RepID=UPI001E3EF0E7|nr:hypothetical protein [Chromobacterium violaceum]